MSDLMDVVRDVSARIEKATIRLDAIQSLFRAESHRIQGIAGDFMFDSNVKLETVYQNDHSTVSNVTYARKDIGHPMHAHNDLVEYLIVTKGRFLLKTSSFFRVMVQGDCASIVSGLDHTTIPLEEGSEMLAVCVPPERAYLKQE